MGQFEQVDIDRAKELIAEGNLTIVDIRSEADYEEGHIDGAVSVGDNNIEEFVSSTDKSKPILIYCYHGFTSQSASQYFVDQGFNHVYSLIGGYEEWSQSGE